MPSWNMKPGQGGVQLLDGVQVGGVNGTALYRVAIGTVSIDPADVATATTVAPTFTLTGAATGDLVLMIPPSNLEDDLIPKGAVVTASNTVTVYLYNAAAGNTNGAALTWTYIWLKTNF